MKKKIFYTLSRPRTWKTFMLLSTSAYLSLLFFQDGSEMWKLWWAPSKAIGFFFAILCLISLVLHIFSIKIPFFEKWLKKS